VGMVVFAVLPFTTVYFAQPLFELDFFWWRITGAVVMIMGAILLIWSKFKFVPQEEMITTGPYQYIRHPQYLGLIFAFVGWWWVWQAVYSFYFGMFIVAMVWFEAFLEEKLILIKRFGDKFKEYRRKTGMFWIK
jgi:protein-S-isoprenylcysteine O-methyltransferase Ste14